MQAYREAIARQEAPIAHATILDVLADLDANIITEGQAYTLLVLLNERVSRYLPDQGAVFRAAIEAIHQLQGEEQEP